MTSRMTPGQRVLAALRGQEPDRVPFMELGVDRALARQLLGWGGPTSQRADLEAQAYTPEEAKEVARHLGLDNISFVLRAPVFADKLDGKDGRLFYGEGHIKSRADLERIELPDPEVDTLYAEAREFVTRKEDFAACFVTRAGIFPTLLSMGLQTFATALYDDPALVEEVLDRYFSWSVSVARRACALGFDVYVSTDDMAFKTAPYFSPALFRELVLPRYRKLARAVSIPWIIHSDGNILPFLEDILSLGVAGIHPLENGAMDIRTVKREYGHRVCLIGNVDLNLLASGSPEAVEAEVRALILDLAPGGGYILSSGNSLAGYCLPANVEAMAAAARQYGAGTTSAVAG